MCNNNDIHSSCMLLDIVLNTTGIALLVFLSHDWSYDSSSFCSRWLCCTRTMSRKRRKEKYYRRLWMMIITDGWILILCQILDSSIWYLTVARSKFCPAGFSYLKLWFHVRWNKIILAAKIIYFISDVLPCNTKILLNNFILTWNRGLKQKWKC